MMGKFVSVLIASIIASNNGIVLHGRTMRDTVKANAKKDPLLLFWSVGNDAEIMQLVNTNIEHARQAIPSICTVLAHYTNGGRDAWENAMGKDWYRDHVNITTEKQGYKLQILQTLVKTGDLDVGPFKWLWALDEDMDISGVTFHTLIEEAEASQALITAPGIIGPSYWSDIVGQHTSCKYRHVNFIEVMCPMFRSDVVKDILVNCENCLHKNSVWGLDQLWCSWAASRTSTPIEQSCAVIDATAVVHTDHKSLEGKYNTEGQTNQDFRRVGWADEKDLRERYPDHFVEEKNVKEYNCELVNYASGVNHSSR